MTKPELKSLVERQREGIPNCDREKYLRTFRSDKMKKPTAVCCVMILLFLATLRNVDGLVPASISNKVSQ